MMMIETNTRLPPFDAATDQSTTTTTTNAILPFHRRERTKERKNERTNGVPIPSTYSLGDIALLAEWRCLCIEKNPRRIRGNREKMGVKEYGETLRV